MGFIVGFISLFIVSYLVVVGIHETGHIFAGIIAGFEFQFFVVGPLGLRREKNSGVAFYFEKNPALWGGVSATVPKTEKPENYTTFANILIAGPLASLCFGIICLATYALFSNLFLLMLTAESLAISIATMIPMRAGLFYTDGGRWLRMKKDPKARAVEKAIFNASQSFFINGDYSGLDISEIRVLTDDFDPRNRFLGHYYAMLYYKTNSDNVNAAAEKEAMKQLEPEVPKSFIRLLTDGSQRER